MAVRLGHSHYCLCLEFQRLDYVYCFATRQNTRQFAIMFARTLTIHKGMFSSRKKNKIVRRRRWQRHITSFTSSFQRRLAISDTQNTRRCCEILIEPQLQRASIMCIIKWQCIEYQVCLCISAIVLGTRINQYWNFSIPATAQWLEMAVTHIHYQTWQTPCVWIENNCTVYGVFTPHTTSAYPLS